MRASLAWLVGWLLFAAPAEALDIPFTLTRPAGPGPHPAVVLLHDCSGLGPRSSGAPWRWSAELTRLGYVTLWPDSFSSRGFPNGVCTEPARAAVGPGARRADAYAALEHLRSLPFVDPARIAVMGGSHGGSTVLASIVATPANAAHRPGFVAAIALYPGCAFDYGDWHRTEGVFRPLAPLLILVGEADDWTPAAPCVSLAASAQAQGLPVETRVYPGAHHSFDSAAPLRYDPNRMNIRAPGGRGATTGGNPAAWAEAREAVRLALARAFAP